MGRPMSDHDAAPGLRALADAMRAARTSTLGEYAAQHPEMVAGQPLPLEDDPGCERCEEQIDDADFLNPACGCGLRCISCCGCDDDQRYGPEGRASRASAP